MTRTITVNGMACGHYEQTVEEALLAVAGVSDVEGDRVRDRASVEGDADVSASVRTVEEAGYPAHA